ncbi:PqqD family protein [Candidatus Omnitrophota bacterium]
MMYKRAHRVPWRIVDDKAVLVSVKNSEVMVLNEVGTEIWTFMEEKRNLDQIIEHVLSTFDTDKETAEDDVRNFLEDMKEKEALDAE